jgi:AcrR family transcriptional regulator
VPSESSWSGPHRELDHEAGASGGVLVHPHAPSHRLHVSGRDRKAQARAFGAGPDAAGSVHALFGSKEELQLATINAARDSFVTEVVAPAFATTDTGRERLMALCDGYLAYVERRVFPGGCFFVAVSAEVGARPGRVHDEVARIQSQWRDLLDAEARSAYDRGELPEGRDPAQLAFELGVILAGTDIVTVLHDDNRAIARARAAVRDRLSG